MCCVKYRLTSGDHHGLPYKKHLESVTILGLPVSVCSEHRFLPDGCHVTKGKAVGWSRYVPVFPPLFPVAAPADHLQVVAGVVRPKKSPVAGFRASMPVHASSTSRLGKSRLNTAKRIPGDGYLTSVISATQTHAIPVAASIVCCLQACTVIQTSSW
jgi:hypothetical protein